ncbi:anti-sigma-factor antagonist [Mycolicibacterium phlei]|nr:anti-sigma-factor antagonist [Mycolicibacterium phlei]
MMTTPLQLRTERADDGSLLLAAVGELDLSNIAEFTAAVAEMVADQPDSPMTVDLSAVEYLDSGAINVLFGHVGRIRRIVVNPILMPVLRVSGLTAVAAVVVPDG